MFLNNKHQFISLTFYLRNQHKGDPNDEVTFLVTIVYLCVNCNQITDR